MIVRPIRYQRSERTWLVARIFPKIRGPSDVVISRGVDPPDPSSPKGLTCTISNPNWSRIAVTTACARAPARSRWAALPPRVYETGNVSEGASQPKTTHAVVKPSRTAYSAARGYAVPNTPRATATSTANTIAATSARARVRPAGTRLATIAPSVIVREATPDAGK